VRSSTRKGGVSERARNVNREATTSTSPVGCPCGAGLPPAGRPLPRFDDVFGARLPAASTASDGHRDRSKRTWTIPLRSAPSERSARPGRGAARPTLEPDAPSGVSGAQVARGLARDQTCLRRRSAGAAPIAEKSPGCRSRGSFQVTAPAARSSAPRRATNIRSRS
jgi:hypothetical protein